MQFYPPNAPVPETLKTPEFTLRPLTPAHVELDHAALMSSKQMLRLWSGHPESGWPKDDFSVADNMKDMEWHYDDHLKRIAFTFTVLNPAENEVLGCVYIVPFEPLLKENPHLSAMIGDDVGLVRLWVIEPRIGDGLDKRLLQTLCEWFETEWAFKQIYFHVYHQYEQQIQMMEQCGLEQVRGFDLPRYGGRHLLYT